MKIYKDEEKKTDFYKLWLSNSTISNNASNEVFFFLLKSTTVIGSQKDHEMKYEMCDV